MDRGKLTNHLVDEINRDPTYFSLYDFLSCHYPKKINQVIQTLAKSGVLSNPETADVPYSKKKNALNDIQTFIKNSGGRMYIPGSSLKGAFRTAIITAMIRRIEQNMENTGMIL